jgi:hypothetical protein
LKKLGRSGCKDYLRIRLVYQARKNRVILLKKGEWRALEIKERLEQGLK